MSVIPKSTQPHWTESITLELIYEAVEMIDHRPDNSLVLIISLNNNVIFPKCLPKLIMLILYQLGLCAGNF